MDRLFTWREGERYHVGFTKLGWRLLVLDSGWFTGERRN